MDKCEEITSRLHYLKKVISDEMPYSVQRRTLAEIDCIASLVCGCVDNDTVLVLYDRSQLDYWKSQFTNEPATDEEWDNFRNHKDVDYAYENASEYLNGAESNVIDEDKYLESEVKNG